MLRSNRCRLSGKTPEQLADLQECLYDPGINKAERLQSKHVY